MGSIIRGMVSDMNETRLCSLEQLQAFVQATVQVQFSPAEGEDARYAHIEAVLKRLGYRRLRRKEKGLVLRYLMRTTGYSRQQVTRLGRHCQALPSAGAGLCAHLYGGRCGAAGRDRRPAQWALGAGHPAPDAARPGGVWRHPLRAAGEGLGGTPPHTART